MNHAKLADIAIAKLKEIEGITKIVLYGSVCRGNYTKKSDIDIAMLFHDSMRMFPLDLEGFPIGFRQKVERITDSISDQSSVFFHIPFYWQSEYDKGIVLDDGRKPSPELLNEVGKVVYENCY